VSDIFEREEPVEPVEAQEPEPTLTSYAPGHGPDGPIEGWTPPEPPPPPLRAQLRAAIDMLSKVLEQLP
jgi:hypothetical protein